MKLKTGGSVDEALRKTDDKGYAMPFETDGRKLVKGGRQLLHQGEDYN